MCCRQENCQDQQKESRIKFFSFCFFFSQTQISLRAEVAAFVQIPVMSFKIAFLSTWHTFKQNAKVWANYYILQGFC